MVIRQCLGCGKVIEEGDIADCTCFDVAWGGTWYPVGCLMIAQEVEL